MISVAVTEWCSLSRILICSELNNSESIASCNGSGRSDLAVDLIGIELFDDLIILLCKY